MKSGLEGKYLKLYGLTLRMLRSPIYGGAPGKVVVEMDRDLLDKFMDAVGEESRDLVQ